jgi:F420-dependent oxidoreductase-like protein
VRYGLLITPNKPIPELIDDIRAIRDGGFPFVGCSQIFGYDTLTLFAVAGAQVPDIELHTAVVPIYPRHPLMMAAQALTVQAATGGRLVLGIGLSHKVVIENTFGYSFDQPARHMAEYLEVLMPAVRGEKVDYRGETVRSVANPLQVEAPAPPVLVAALGHIMLGIAGRLADGTTTWMVGTRTLAEYTVPAITTAAADAGRPAPQIEVGLPVCVTNDADAARARAAKSFAIYGQLPSYRAMLDREGAAGPADVALIGDEDAVAAELARVQDAGATSFAAALFGSSEERARTTALLQSLAASAMR